MPRRPRVLVVTPFAVFPPRHGGARRTAGLLTVLRRDFDIVLLSDEASLYDARSFADFDGLHALLLVQRGARTKAGAAGNLAQRMEAHAHPTLVAGLEQALDRYRPDLVHIEHVELAGLVAHRRPGSRWLLGLHDAYGSADFDSPAAALRFQNDMLARYDAHGVLARG